MRLATLLAAAGAASTSLAAGPVQFDLRSKNVRHAHTAGYLVGAIEDALGIDKRSTSGGIPSNLTLSPSYNFYITNISIGTPAQQVEVGFDTGSPYLWVYGPNTTYHNAAQFYPSKSSTFDYTGANFTGVYSAGVLLGQWGDDSIHVGEDSLQSFPFGVIENYTVSAGVPGLIGIGPGPNLTNETYSNVPEAFYQKNVTNSPAFSIFLDKNSNNGGVIFGGYDESKFKGPVYSYNIVSTSQYQPSYYYQLRLDSTKLDGEDYQVSGVVILDTGSPFCQLPPGFVNKVGKKLGLASYDKYQAYYAGKNVSIADLTEVITFNVGKFSVDIPAKDFFVPGEYLWGADGPQGVQALAMSGAPQYVLGDVFFKHVYAALDSKNMKIYLAEATYDFSTSKVKEFGAGGAFANATPGALPLPTGSYTTLTPRPPNSVATPIINSAASSSSQAPLEVGIGGN